MSLRQMCAILVQEFEEEDDDHITTIVAQTVANNSVSFLALENEPPTSIEGYHENVVNLYSDLDFHSHFRMTRGTFEKLYQHFALLLACKTVAQEKKLLATLWLLGNTECYRSVGDRFNFSKGGLHNVVLTVCAVISEERQRFIQWPTLRELPQLEAAFAARSGFPGVIGAIDVTHIPITGPKRFQDTCINRKGTPSMQAQLIVDSTLKIRDWTVGWGGSAHDACILKNSPACDTIATLPPQYHVLGDSAYPLMRNLMVPFRDNGHLGLVERRFNTKHSSTRVEVERAIGRLKCKFRRMRSLDMRLIPEMAEFITTAAVLHNFILDHEGHDDDNEDPQPDYGHDTGEADEEVNDAAALKRQEIAIAF